MTLKDLLEYRRSVRVFDSEKEIDAENVKECLDISTLSANSSNLQLWQFFHIVDKEMLEKLSVATLSQKATKTNKQMVIFVTRLDWVKKRGKQIIEFEKTNLDPSNKEDFERRIKDREMYYGKLMPFLYMSFFGILGIIRKIITFLVGLTRPIVREVSESDSRVIAHKSCALAAQSFMLAMAEKGYDTCPMEGFDSYQIKKLLKLPNSAEITMVVSCGIRKMPEGIYGKRFRVPFEDVYVKL